MRYVLDPNIVADWLHNATISALTQIPSGNLVVAITCASYRSRSSSVYLLPFNIRFLPKIDVMYLYTEGGKTVLGGISDTQMQTTIATALVTTNEAMTNSEIDLEISPVHIGLVRSLNVSGPNHYRITNTWA